jgi:hypothetical protein
MVRVISSTWVKITCNETHGAERQERGVASMTGARRTPRA